MSNPSPTFITSENRSNAAKLAAFGGMPDTALDNLVRRAAEALNMPYASLSFFDPGVDSHAPSEIVKSSYGTVMPSRPLTESLFYNHAQHNTTLVFNDLTRDSQFANFHLHPSLSLCAYAGAAIVIEIDRRLIIIGVLAVYDERGRNPSQRDVAALSNLAAMVSARLTAKPGGVAKPDAVSPAPPALDLSHAMQRLSLALASSGLAVWDWDLVAHRIYFNADWGKLLGRDSLEATFSNKDLLSWIHKDDKEKFIVGMQNAIGGSTNDFECEYRALDATQNWTWILARGMVTERSAAGMATRMNGTCANITKRKSIEAHAEFLATRDPLTALPNRMLLNDRLEQGLANAARKRSRLAFMFIDLDRFKTINDSLGHDVGDALLKNVAQRLLACVRTSDTVARLGGDEFAVIIENLPGTENEGAQNVAEKMIAAMASPILINGHTLTTSCSIGIGVYPDDGNDSQTLMKHADVAMYDAKNKGRNNYQFFSHALNARAQERLTIENFLRLALRRNELVLYYQPRVSFTSGKITAVEALLRWQHPRHGLLLPEKFISVAEDSGLMVAIGEWVFTNACLQLVAWQKKLGQSLKLAVNLSATQLLDGERLIRTMQQSLTLTRLGAQQIELEITEGMLQKNSEETTLLLNRLGALGLGLTIDDFGTGYSSLSNLKRLPVKSIKVHGSFVRDIGIDANDEAVIRAMIAMTHSLKLNVIAEGVENQQQFNALNELACDEFQGYYFAKPMTAAAFEEFFVAKNK